jgi:nicotinamidase-related amidase
MPIDLGQLLAPPSCAVITHELQESVLGEGAQLQALVAEATPTLPAVRRLLAGARAAGAPVVHNTMGPSAVPSEPPNSPLASAMARGRGDATRAGDAGDARGAEVLVAIGPDSSDYVVERHHGMSAFPGTELDAVLRSLRIGTIVAAGVSLNLGIIALAADAVSLGYRVVVATDAVAGTPKDYGQAVIDNTLAVLATRLTVDEILAVWAQGRTT